jgi:hypothetical protein
MSEPNPKVQAALQALAGMELRQIWPTRHRLGEALNDLSWAFNERGSKTEGTQMPELTQALHRHLAKKLGPDYQGLAPWRIQEMIDEGWLNQHEVDEARHVHPALAACHAARKMLAQYVWKEFSVHLDAIDSGDREAQFLQIFVVGDDEAPQRVARVRASLDLSDLMSLIDFAARQYKEGQMRGEQALQQRLRHVLGLSA